MYRSLFIFLPIVGLLAVFDGMDLPVAPPKNPPPPEEDDGPRLYDEEIDTRTDTVIYVIDISGSMGSGSTNYVGSNGQPTYGSKIERAKAELIKSINSLDDDFKFNIVAYSCNLQRVFQSMNYATFANKARAIGWVQNLRAGGGTASGPAGALGLSEKDNLTLVILSDGSPGCGAPSMEAHKQMILSADTQGAVIHTFGIAANGRFEAFLRSLSDATGGIYYDIN